MVVPPQQVAPPQQQHAPQGAPHAPQGAPHAPQGYPMPAPRPRSSKGLVIGLGVGAVAVAGTIAAVVLLRGGGSGAGSRDDLVKQTLAAVSEGNVDKLVKLSDPVGLYNLALDCSERDKATKDADKAKADEEDKGMRDAGGDEAGDDVDDPQIQEKRVRRKHEKLVEKMKGMKIELVSIEAEKAKDGEQDKEDAAAAAERAKGRVMKKGDKASKGCVFKVDVELHALVAKIRVTEPDAKAPSEGEAKLLAVDAGGSWFLWEPPAIRAGSGALATKLRKYRDQMCACKDAACAEEADKEMKDWARSARGEAKDLPQDEVKLLEEIDDEMKVCREKLRAADKDAVVKEAVAKLEELKTKMCACAEPACVDGVQQELTGWAKQLSERSGDAKPSAADDAKADELMKAMKECTAKAMAGSTAPKPPDDPLPPEDPSGGTGAGPSGGPSGGTDAGGGGSLSSVPACAEYRRQIDKIGACRKYPRSAVDGMKKGFEQLEKGWASARPNAAAREAIAKVCAESAESLKKARETICQ
jgi:hypothetical protein